MVDKKEKKDSKLKTWFQTKAKAVMDWYNKDDNFLRRVRFPGTKLPLLTVLVNFFKLFTKGRTVDRAAGVAFNFFVALFPLILLLEKHPKKMMLNIDKAISNEAVRQNIFKGNTIYVTEEG